MYYETRRENILFLCFSKPFLVMFLLYLGTFLLEFLLKNLIEKIAKSDFMVFSFSNKMY